MSSLLCVLWFSAAGAALAGDLGDYHFGDSRKPWIALQQEALKPGSDLGPLLILLESGASVDAKDEACRILALAARPEAVPVLVRILGTPSPSGRGKGEGRVAEMARYALLSIPGPEAEQARGELQLKAEGTRKEDKALASSDPSLLKPLLDPRMPWALRTAALKRLAEVQGLAALPVLVPSLRDKEPEFRAQAVLSLESLKEPEATQALASALEGAEPPLKLLLLASLGRKGDFGARLTLQNYGSSAEADLREAAVQALGDLGDPSSLAWLAETAARGTEPESKTAQSSLARLRGPGIGEGLLALIPGTLGPARPELIRALGRRRVPGAAGLLAGEARGPDENSRAAAFASLVQRGDQESRSAVLAALHSKVPEVKDGALRALADWPDNSVRDELLLVAQAKGSQVRRVLALRGLIRMAGSDLGQLDVALSLADRVEEKRAVLAGLGGSDSSEALARLKPYFKDKDLKGEALAAAVQVAGRRARAFPEESFALASEVLGLEPPDKVREEAEKVQARATRGLGWITRWEVSESYEKEGMGPEALYKEVFAPETGGGTWKAMDPKGGGLEKIQLDEALGGKNRVAYLRATLSSDMDQEAVLEAGSDDGLKAWLNGTLVIESNRVRSFKEGEDSAKVPLRKGDNLLLLKVTQGEGEWLAAVRVRAPAGESLKGFRIKQGP